jgi:uncharacterized Ntn-hydrolase superfamily protein
MTYSIIARDEETGCFGVAVHSHALAVGFRVPWALAGVGAVATQASTRSEYGPAGLSLLSDGLSAEDALAQSIRGDAGAPLRQVAMIDAQGRTAAHTGDDCWGYAAHHAVDQVSAQANMCSSAHLPRAMVERYLESTGPFPYRLLAALDAAEELGGDLRGRQSAAILIVGPDRVREVDAGVVMDLRVDDASEPHLALRRLVELTRANGPMRALLGTAACRGPIRPTSAETAEAVELLERTQEVYGTGNREPDFWRAVVLWRSGRRAESVELVGELARIRPGWKVLFDDVTSRGDLGDD